MKKQILTLVTVIGLAVLTSCATETTEQTQGQTQQETSQEAPAVTTDSTMVDSTVTK